LPPNTGRIFNYDCSGEYITGKAADAAQPAATPQNQCTIKAVSVIGVRSQQVVADGTSANRRQGENASERRFLR
jgi:hypothetical protein